MLRRDLSRSDPSANSATATKHRNADGPGEAVGPGGRSTNGRRKGQKDGEGAREVEGTGDGPEAGRVAVIGRG